MFPTSCQLSKLCSSNTSAPQMYITGISRLSTFMQHNCKLHSPLHFGGSYNCSKYLLLGHVYHTPCLAHSCCEVMTPQCYRYMGAVRSHLNYLQTGYGAPTGSSSRDRKGTKTHFESRLHIDLTIFTNHM